MKTLLIACTLSLGLISPLAAGPKKKEKADDSFSLKAGADAPDFRIEDTNGEEINLADLTRKGPVLVRLTCGCKGCDLELPYFQALHETYKDKGLVSLAIFAEPDGKFAEYAKDKEIEMRYALDPKKESWKVFGAKAMPSNFLIDKGGKIVAVSKGCNPEGLKALALGNEAAQLVRTDAVDLTEKVEPPKAKKKKAAKQ